MITVRQHLEAAVAAGRLRPLDLHFALWLQRIAGGSTEDTELLLLAAALVSQGVGQGHVCFDLATLSAKSLDLFRPALECFSAVNGPAPWREKLLASPVVGVEGAATPLILDSRNRLYLGRYWRLEQDLAAHLQARAGRLAESVDLPLLRKGLTRYFPPKTKTKNQAAESGATDWQQVAAALAVLRPFCIISGGPGTGKTRTVTAILALLLDQAEITGHTLRIALAAPTGKAAARLSESMQLAIKDLSLPATMIARMPDGAGTLHRLLGFRPDRVRPRHDRRTPLPIDLLVVDEASMIDLPLMARLLDALRPETRLILLGDRDQLASVEAGRVLGDICGRGTDSGYGKEQWRMLEDLGITGVPRNTRTDIPPIADPVVVLRRSYRFDKNSGIGVVARAVNAGDIGRTMNALQEGGYGDLHLETLDPDDIPALLRSWFLPRMRNCLAGGSPGEILQNFASFRILAAVHEGPFGVRRLNRLCEQLLLDEGLLEPGDGEIRHGQPFMITRNEYRLNLFNGDVGMFWGRAGEAPMAWLDGRGRLRTVRANQLPFFESVFAMTVHKSQGSEFDDVLLVLPESEARVLTRELLYTAVTRAKRSLYLIARPDSIRQAVQNRVQRSSGLHDALWGSV